MNRRRKNPVEYLPIYIVYGFVIASFIDYNFNYCLSLILEGHKIQSIIYIIIYNVSLVFFVYCYYMVTNTDPGSPSKDAVNIISDVELASYYSSLEESSELKNMIESSYSDNSHLSSGALLKKEEKLDNDFINCNLTADNTNDLQLSTATLNNKSNKNNNYSIDIPLLEISSTSNTNVLYDGSTETLINSLNSNPTKKEKAVVFDTFLMQKPDLGNGDNLHTINQFDHISIDIDNDSIIERNIQKLNNNSNNNENNNNYLNKSSEDERPSINSKINNENGEQKNNLVCKKCFGYKPERTHHCSICKRCILKMDHHCPWIGGCVGFYNYKYFLLFLFYGTIFIVFQFITILISFILLFHSFDKLQENFFHFPFYKQLWIIHIFFAFIFGFSVSFMFISHILENVLGNSTTLEFFDKQRRIQKYRYNVRKDNYKRKINKLENEIKEIEEFILNFPSARNINKKRKELKKKRKELKSKIKANNELGKYSFQYVSQSTKNIPKSILHNPYNIGKLKNFYQVFGESPKRWFIPVPSSLGDGYHFPKREFKSFI